MSKNIPESDLTQLVLRARNGNVSGMAELFEATYKRLYYFSYMIAGNSDNAQDLLQEGFIKCMSALDTLRDPRDFYAWMWRILRNTHMNMLRKDRYAIIEAEEEHMLDALISEDDTPEISAEKNEMYRILRFIIDALPNEQREAVLLRYYEDLSVSEIAVIQECPAATVKSRLLYAKRAIKSAIIAEENRSGTLLHSTAVFPILPRIFQTLSSYVGISSQTALAVFVSAASALGFTAVSDSVKLLGTVEDESHPITGTSCIVKIKLFPAAMTMVCLTAVFAVLGSAAAVRYFTSGSDTVTDDSGYVYHALKASLPVSSEASETEDLFTAETKGTADTDEVPPQLPETDAETLPQISVTVSETAKAASVRTTASEKPQTKAVTAKETTAAVISDTTAVTVHTDAPETSSETMLHESSAETEDTVAETSNRADITVNNDLGYDYVTQHTYCTDFHIDIANNPKRVLEVGQSFPIIQACEPSSATDQSIIIRSSDPSVAYASTKEIVAVSPGTARIFLYSEHNTNHDASFLLEVLPKNEDAPEPEKLFFKETSAFLIPGCISSLNWSTEPSIVKAGSYEFVSDNPEILTFDGLNMYVYKPGTTAVRAIRISDGTEIGSIELTVRSSMPEIPDVIPEKIGFLNFSDICAMKVGDIREMKYYFEPNGVTEEDWYWDYSNEGVLTFDGKNITAIAPGSTYINVYRKFDGKSIGYVFISVTD